MNSRGGGRGGIQDSEKEKKKNTWFSQNFLLMCILAFTFQSVFRGRILPEDHL